MISTHTWEGVVARVTDKHDMPRAAFTALFYTVLIFGGGMAFRGGWELMGRMLN